MDLVSGHRSSRPATLYAVAGGGGLFDPPAAIYKTTNGGANWINASIAQPDVQAAPFIPITLVFDPSDSNTIYLGGVQGVLKSSDGGAHWNATGLTGNVGRLAIDGSKISFHLEC